MLGDIVIHPCHRSLGLSPLETIILAVVDNFTQNGRDYTGGLDALAKELGVSHNTIQTAMSSLRKQGLISSQKRGKTQTGVYISALKSETPKSGGSLESETPKIGSVRPQKLGCHINNNIEKQREKQNNISFMDIRPTISEIRRVYVENKIDPNIYSPETFLKEHKDEYGYIRNSEGAKVTKWQEYLLILWREARDRIQRENLTYRPVLSPEERERRGKRYGVTYQIENKAK